MPSCHISWQPGLSGSAGSSSPIRGQVLVDGSVFVHSSWHSRYMAKHCQCSLMCGLTDSRLVSAGPDLYILMWSRQVMPCVRRRQHWSTASRRARYALVGALHSDGDVVWLTEWCEPSPPHWLVCFLHGRLHDGYASVNLKFASAYATYYWTKICELVDTCYSLWPDYNQGGQLCASLRDWTTVFFQFTWRPSLDDSVEKVSNAGCSNSRSSSRSATLSVQSRSEK